MFAWPRMGIYKPWAAINAHIKAERNRQRPTIRKHMQPVASDSDFHFLLPRKESRIPSGAGYSVKPCQLQDGLLASFRKPTAPSCAHCHQPVML